jgi:isoaspartyl peptidase/L-asparaginase-like protein (Ntn-hydrolase superfamily)
MERDGYDASGLVQASVVTNIANQSDLDSAAITPLDVSTNFANATSYGGSFPTGLSINPTTGVISGTPTPGAGLYPSYVIAFNGDSPGVYSRFYWTLT